MSTEAVRIKKMGFYALLTIDRSEALNALNQEVFNQLESFFSVSYRSFYPLRGIVLTGAGSKAFVAGADIKELQRLTPRKAEELVERGHRVLNIFQGNGSHVLCFEVFTFPCQFID